MNESDSATIVEIYTVNNILPSTYPSVRTQSESSTLSAPRCRICWVTSEEADLYSTCYCKGSVGKVHVSCLERWLQESRTDFCDLCFYDYTLEKRPRYTVLGSLLPFWRNIENRRRCKQLLAAIPGITFLVILAAGCCLLALFALDDMKPDMVDNTYNLLKAILLFSLILILAIYGSLFLSLFDDLHNIWKTWRDGEQVVRLILSKSLSEGKSPSGRSVLERP